MGVDEAVMGEDSSVGPDDSRHDSSWSSFYLGRWSMISDNVLLLVDVPAKTSHSYSFWGNEVFIKNGGLFNIRIEVSKAGDDRLLAYPQGNENLLSLMQGDWEDIVDEEDFVGIADQLWAEEVGFA